MSPPRVGRPAGGGGGGDQPAGQAGVEQARGQGDTESPERGERPWGALARCVSRLSRQNPVVEGVPEPAHRFYWRRSKYR